VVCKVLMFGYFISIRIDGWTRCAQLWLVSVYTVVSVTPGLFLESHQIFS
jgi:hypothetical protein